MTMYLPNPDLHPTGSEPGEFIDVPAIAHEVTGETRATWAQEYISGLVENHHGDSEDVRSILHELHDQSTLTDHDGGW